MIHSRQTKHNIQAVKKCYQMYNNHFVHNHFVTMMTLYTDIQAVKYFSYMVFSFAPDPLTLPKAICSLFEESEKEQQ